MVSIMPEPIAPSNGIFESAFQQWQPTSVGAQLASSREKMRRLMSALVFRSERVRGLTSAATRCVERHPPGRVQNAKLNPARTETMASSLSLADLLPAVSD